MSNEMNNLIKKMIKYDLIGGFIFALIFLIAVNIRFTIIFLLGIIISLISVICNGVILEYALKNDKMYLLLLSYILRTLFTVIIAIPFLNNLMEFIAYIVGYIAHFIFQTLYWIKNWKEGI
jgi:ATP synthase protein I